jgi:predicted DNA-binding protein with PD1-like motif
MKLFLSAILVLMSCAAFAQDSGYISMSEAKPHGSAPGMKVKLIAANPNTREYAVILAPGDEVLSGLTQFAIENHVVSGHFTAIGAVQRATLGWWDEQKKKIKKIPVNEPSEIVSLAGDIALLNGAPVVHAHMVVSGSDGAARGGHLLEAIVSPTCEIFVTADAKELVKRTDPATGISLITPDAK